MLYPVRLKGDRFSILHNEQDPRIIGLIIDRFEKQQARDFFGPSIFTSEDNKPGEPDRWDIIWNNHKVWGDFKSKSASASTFTVSEPEYKLAKEITESDPNYPFEYYLYIQITPNEIEYVGMISFDILVKNSLFANSRFENGGYCFKHLSVQKYLK